MAAGPWSSVLARPRVLSQPLSNGRRRRTDTSPRPLCGLTLFTTLTADTDSEEDFLKDEWSAQGPSGSRLASPVLCGLVAKRGKPAGGPKLTRRGLAAARTLKPKLAAGGKQPFCLLLQEVEARSSFSDSSDDSFDQGY